MFRRRAAKAPAALPADGAGGAAAGPGGPRDARATRDASQGRPDTRPAGKGRPTPKRSEAEKRRRQPLTAPPADRRTASKQSRGRDKAERARRMQAMRRGEEWALPAKDRGPVRALARNYVDSRRTLSEFYLIGAFALLLVLFIPGFAQRHLLNWLLLGIVAVLVIETTYHGTRLVRLVRERYPGESTKGVRMYMAKRMIAMRSARIPGPAVKPGDKI